MSGSNLTIDKNDNFINDNDNDNDNPLPGDVVVVKVKCDDLVQWPQGGGRDEV